MALKEGLGKVPAFKNADAFFSGAWNYLPIAILVFAAVVFLFRTFAPTPQAKGNNSTSATNLENQPVKIPEADEFDEFNNISNRYRDRSFIPSNISIDYLIGLYEGHTSIQGERLTKPYTGKWMIVTGVVYDITKHSNIYSISLGVPRGGKLKIDSKTRIMFSANWEDKISVLRKGDTVKAIGRIDEIEPHAVWLKDCELV